MPAYTISKIFINFVRISKIVPPNLLNSTYRHLVQFSAHFQLGLRTNLIELLNIVLHEIGCGIGTKTLYLTFNSSPGTALFIVSSVLKYYNNSIYSSWISIARIVK